MSDKLRQFQHRQYLNLETFRKNGQGLKTPVWFTQDGNALFIWTASESGKAKRIRRNDGVRIVPSTAAGEPLGEWVDANAVVNDSPETMKRVESFFQKKYSVAFTAFRMMGGIRGEKWTVLILNIK